MALTDRILDGLKSTIQLNEKVAGLAGNVKELAREVRDMDRRLIRVETTLDLATGGRLAPRAIEKRDE